MNEYHNRFQYEIRAHHGMCLAFFEGRGYSDGFIKHMQDMKDGLEEDAGVRLIREKDEICAFCPNNKEGRCESADKVGRYDKEVLRLCGLQAGTLISWKHFTNLVEERILLSGKRAHICGDCQWNSLCSAKERR